MEDAQKWVFVPNRVNHYEFERPLKILYHNASLFSSPTGVNHYESYQVKLVGASFGVFVPNRGLTIMNVVNYDYWTHMFVFPSPTGVNHYECKANEWVLDHFDGFPSPTGVNHYESVYKTSSLSDTVSVSVPYRG